MQSGVQPDEPQDDCVAQQGEGVEEREEHKEEQLHVWAEQESQENEFCDPCLIFHHALATVRVWVTAVCWWLRSKCRSGLVIKQKEDIYGAHCVLTQLAIPFRVITSDPFIHTKVEIQSVQVTSLSGHKVSCTVSISKEFY